MPGLYYFGGDVIVWFFIGHELAWDYLGAPHAERSISEPCLIKPNLNECNKIQTTILCVYLRQYNMVTPLVHGLYYSGYRLGPALYYAY